MPLTWVKVVPDPSDPSKQIRVAASSPVGGLASFLSGYKTYAVGLVVAAKAWFVVFQGHPWSPQTDDAINLTLVALGVMAIRSGMKAEQRTQTAALLSAPDKVTKVLVVPPSAIDVGAVKNA